MFIYNAIGQLISERQYDLVPSAPILFEVNQLESGVYFMMIKLEGRAAVTKRFVVNKL